MKYFNATRFVTFSQAPLVIQGGSADRVWGVQHLRQAWGEILVYFASGKSHSDLFISEPPLVSASRAVRVGGETDSVSVRGFARVRSTASVFCSLCADLSIGLHEPFTMLRIYDNELFPFYVG